MCIYVHTVYICVLLSVFVLYIYVIKIGHDGDCQWGWCLEKKWGLCDMSCLRCLPRRSPRLPPASDKRIQLYTHTCVHTPVHPLLGWDFVLCIVCLLIL